MKEIRAIFKGLAEYLDPNEIAKELISEGFNPRIVARFKNRERKPMPIILETQQHNKDDEGPNRCSNCDGPHKANFQECPNFPRSEKKEEKMEDTRHDRPRPRRPPRGRELNNPQIQETAPLVEVLSTLDLLRDLILRRPILTEIRQLTPNKPLGRVSSG
ncbi:hypothetical protein JTB14_010084 [Gonioctena quinquepunctata]|nr:hypothetical protein JTB14_010084 [Gonioctena quinquepunctata]